MRRAILNAAVALLFALPGHGTQTPPVADKSITGEMLADGAAVRSINGLTDQVKISAGRNVAVTAVAGGLQISASGAPGPSGAAGPAGPAGIVTMKYAGSTAEVNVFYEKKTMLSIPVTVTDGQKIWVRAHTELKLPNHSGGEVEVMVVQGSTVHTSVSSLGITQFRGADDQNFTLLPFGVSYMTPPLATGTWTVSLVVTRSQAGDYIRAGGSALAAIVVNP
jgi:hypothetical protein